MMKFIFVVNAFYVAGKKRMKLQCKLYVIKQRLNVS